MSGEGLEFNAQRRAAREIAPPEAPETVFESPDSTEGAGLSPFPEHREQIEVAEDIPALERQVVALESTRHVIAEAVPQEPQPITSERAPADVDLRNASQEERMQRRRMIAERYRSVLEQIPRTGKLLELDANGLPAEQEVTPDQIAFVRADDFEPRIDEKGQVEILNAHDATEGELWRLTNHFAINHRVASNNGGNWQNKRYQFVIPGRAMIETNGNPENLYAVDTFWTKSVALPKGSVIIYEKGHKPNIPEHMAGQITLVERDADVNDRELVSAVLEQMEYSEIEGGGRYAAHGYKYVDEAIARLAKAERVSSSAHDGSWSDWYEQIGFHISQLNFSAAVHGLRQIYKDPEALERAPEAQKRRAWRAALEPFSLNPNDIPAIRERERARYEREMASRGLSKETIETAFNKDFSDEVLATKIEEGKASAIAMLDRLLQGQYPHVSNQELATVLNEVPLQAWQYKIDLMKREEIDIDVPKYKDAGEVRDAFRKVIQEPYEHATDRQFEMEHLKFD